MGNRYCIWKFIIDSYQKIPFYYTIQDGNKTLTMVQYNILPTFTKSLLYNNIIYFVSESFNDNAKVLTLNL